MESGRHGAVCVQVGELADLALCPEVHVQQGPAVVHDAVEIWRLRKRVAQPFGEPFADGVDSLYLPLREKVERHAACGHGHEVAVEGPRVVEVAGRAGVEDFHHVRTPAESADGYAAADDLTQRRQVGTDA